MRISAANSPAARPAQCKYTVSSFRQKSHFNLNRFREIPFFLNKCKIKGNVIHPIYIAGVYIKLKDPIVKLSKTFINNSIFLLNLQAYLINIPRSLRASFSLRGKSR